jgi:hypothetical protein
MGTLRQVSIAVALATIAGASSQASAAKSAVKYGVFARRTIQQLPSGRFVLTDRHGARLIAAEYKSLTRHQDYLKGALDDGRLNLHNAWTGTLLNSEPYQRLIEGTEYYIYSDPDRERDVAESRPVLIGESAPGRFALHTAYDGKQITRREPGHLKIETPEADYKMAPDGTLYLVSPSK